MITDDAILNIEVSTADDIFISGRFSQTADFGTLTRTSTGLTDAYVAKLDMNGDFQWVNAWGTTTEPGNNIKFAPAVPSGSPVSGRGQALEFREGSSLQQLTGTSIADTASNGVERVATAHFNNDDLPTGTASTESHSADLSSLDSSFSAFDSELDESLSNTLGSPLTSSLKKRILR